MVDLSVAMCTFNGGRFLAEQLTSLSSQTQLPDELVICDDASSDNTVEIIERFIHSAPFHVQLLHNSENLGSTRNFEKAIRNCRGRLIALSDQDDVWETKKLEVLLSALDQNPDAGYAFSDAEVVTDSGEPVGSHWRFLGFDDTRVSQFVRGDDVEILLKCPVVTGAAMVFRAALTDIVFPIPSYCVHDYWISLLASSLGARGIPVREKLIRYRQHHSQQIGARPRPFTMKIRQSGKRGMADFCRRARFYNDLASRLVGMPCPPRHMMMLREKVKHDLRRTQARKASGISRVSTVCGELMSGRYFRFSDSWLSAVTDLCF